MTTPVAAIPAATLPVVQALEAAARAADTAEHDVRQEAARRIAALEQERTFAYRRLNLVRDLAAALETADAEESAVSIAAAVLGGKLGWSQESEARAEVMERFAPVAQALFRSLRSEDEPDPSPQAALAAFEQWYAESRRSPFWILFDRYVQDTPRVDF
ncbi:hypothetical protein [Rhodoplanes roseus]|uniref:Uncharacterized protein n=1 Tax=Rhodoplanes roseus TaxID=29409 RepID=A0A327KUD1_9BRAD|nr:hypothetical protein [Rhodoplanes roseus]RAI41827.1 hypothetical protein CH341_20905 [Rhodoplanes roseus]